MRPLELVASASCGQAASVVEPRSRGWREPDEGRLSCGLRPLERRHYGNIVAGPCPPSQGLAIDAATGGVDDLTVSLHTSVRPRSEGRHMEIGAVGATMLVG